MAMQIAIVFVGGAAFHVTRIGGREWGISLALGFVSIPWGAIIRLLSTKAFESLFKFYSPSLAEIYLVEWHFLHCHAKPRQKI